jgi:hypothetical protein
MTRQYAKIEGELEESNRWAGELNRELEERRARVAELQSRTGRGAGERPPHGRRL